MTRRAVAPVLAPLLGASWLFLLAGCAALRVEPIEVVPRRPGDVTLYFRVRTSSGEPLGGLRATDFRIDEDGRPLRSSDSAPRLLDAGVAVAHYAVLLVDLSAGVTVTGDRDVLPQAVSAFAVRVGRSAKVAVYAFDGSPDLYPIAGFADPARQRRTASRRLATLQPADPSSNLNGAIVSALEKLESALDQSNRPLKFGTLVVFTSRMDGAHRVATDAMRDRVDRAPGDVFAIGVGSALTRSQLEEIGRDGTAMAADKDGIVKAFDDVGQMIEARAASSYVLSYCSPSRAGRHEVRVEAVAAGAQGHGTDVGSFRSYFDATGFAPGCDVNGAPNHAPPNVDEGGESGARRTDGDAKGDQDHAARRGRRAAREVRATSATPPPARPPSKAPSSGAHPDFVP